MKAKIIWLTVFTFCMAGCSNFPDYRKAITNQANWKTYSYPDFRIFLDSPYSISEDQDSDKNSGFKRQMVKGTRPFPWGSNNFRVLVCAYEGGPEIGLPPSTATFTEMSIKEMKARGFILGDLQSQAKKTICSGYKGTYCWGTYKGFKMIPMRFAFVTVRDHLWLWQIAVFYLDQDEELEKTAQRVLKSIKITPG